MITVGCSLFYFSVLAEQVRQLSWEDLIPAHLATADLPANLSEEQKDMVYWVITTLESLPENGPDLKEYLEKVDKEMPYIKKNGIDIKALIAKKKKLRTAIVEELNGQHVRIPGYLLPLEISDNKVREFLLVPYVGACIHVPPPPPNQIVHVKIVQKEGYAVKKLYEPVWVEGEIIVESLVKDLYLVDGSAGINIGYTMKASRIEPYKS